VRVTLLPAIFIYRRKKEMKPLFDVNGAAQLLAISPWTIRAYIRQGKLHPVRIGRLVRLDESELQAFVTANRVQDKVVPIPTGKETENV
jgi:excisionase family DNA binding protein